MENLNLNNRWRNIRNIKEIERERGMAARVFTWFGYVSLRPQDEAQWATSLLIFSLCNIFLDDYNVL
jgi:hypothetical protein